MKVSILGGRLASFEGVTACDRPARLRESKIDVGLIKRRDEGRGKYPIRSGYLGLDMADRQ